MMSNETPVPVVLGSVPIETADSLATSIRSRVGQGRLGTALFIAGLGWVFGNAALTNVLLAAKVAIIAPDAKVAVLGATTALSAIAVTIALFVWGAISDLTRSRFGRRNPFVLIGAIGAVVFLGLLSISSSLPMLILSYLGYGLTFNALPAALLAVFPDRIPRDKRGTASAVYGGAQTLGGALATIIASRFIVNPDPFLFAGGFVILISAVLFLVLAPDFSNVDQAREKLDVRSLLGAFKFPKKAPDFYWAFVGRFAILFGGAMISTFQLYILTDYIHLDATEAGSTIAFAGVAALATIVIATITAGPISDKIGRRKAPIFLASLMFGVSFLLPVIWPTATAIIISSAISGLGLGAFLSVDSALMTEVLPSEESRGKDLGILNTANTVPQVVAPLVTSLVVGAGFGYPPVYLAALVVTVFGAFSIFKIKSVR